MPTLDILDFATAPNTIAGIWKFHMEVPGSENPIRPATLLELAYDWKKEWPDRYKDIYVRGCGKNQIGINVMLNLGEDGVTLRDYVFRTSDKLRRQFGNDFVGWDLSDSVWLLD